MNTMLKSDIDDGEKAALVADFDKIFGLKLDQPREEYAKKGANTGPKATASAMNLPR